jgi:hypothetical protein
MMKLATDIGCLDRDKLDVWLANSHWPVAEDEFFEMAKILHAEWGSASKSVEPESHDLMFCEYAPNWLAQIVHAEMVKTRVSKSGGQLRTGDLSGAMYAPDWEGVGQAHANELRRSSGRLNARRWARNVMFNRYLPVWRRIGAMFSSDAVALGSNDDLRARYARSRNLGTDNTYISLLAIGDGSASIPEDLQTALDSFAVNFGAILNDRFGVSLDVVGLRKALIARMGTLLSVYWNVRRQARQIPLLVTESANSLHKVAACAWSAGGGLSVGFSHGHPVGEMPRQDRSYWEYFAYDEFVCPSEVCAGAFAADYATTRFADLRPTRFVAQSNEHRTSSSVFDRDASFPRKVGRVMLMGYPMVAQRFLFHHGYFWATQLELEIRLARLLHEGGFQVLYKVHPEMVQPVSGIMESIGCQVVSGHFGEATDTVDAFLVKYVASSAFPEVLKSAKPVYLIDADCDLWNPAYRERLARRCVVFPAEIGRDGRVRFDEGALLDRLSGEQALPDYSYVTQYYQA